MGSFRMRRALVLACGAALAGVVACGDLLTEGTGDANPPALDLAGTASGNDTLLTFSADARDNLGLKTIRVSATGGLTFTFDTTFTTAVTSTTILFRLSVPRSVPTGTAVTVVGFATDGSGNRSIPDTLRLTVGNVASPSVGVVSPGFSRRWAATPASTSIRTTRGTARAYRGRAVTHSPPPLSRSSRYTKTAATRA